MKKFWFSLDDKIRFLMEKKGLSICKESVSNYFLIPIERDVKLCGGIDAVLVFNSVKEKNGKIIDIDFSLLSVEEFLSKYKVMAD